jgi:hypothetical protein
MHKGSITLMLGLNLKKYCENNEIVFNPMFTSRGGELCENGIVILDVFLNMLIPTALPVRCKHPSK